MPVLETVPAKSWQVVLVAVALAVLVSLPCRWSEYMAYGMKIDQDGGNSSDIPEVVKLAASS